MTTEGEMLRMQVHGEPTRSCYLELETDEYGETTGVKLMKDGNLCWSKNKTDLVFDYLTEDL